jgi:hypothetical protein
MIRCTSSLEKMGCSGASQSGSSCRIQPRVNQDFESGPDFLRRIQAPPVVLVHIAQRERALLALPCFRQMAAQLGGSLTLGRYHHAVNASGVSLQVFAESGGLTGMVEGNCRLAAVVCQFKQKRQSGHQFAVLGQ